MTATGENTLSPLQIDDAREAAYRASELQRECEDGLAKRSRELANAERRYRKALALMILNLHTGNGPGEWAGKKVAITACEVIARGDGVVSQLREERDVAQGLLDAVRQQVFRRGADRRDLTQLIDWSMRRDLRTDTPPPQGQIEQPIGGR